MRLLFMGTPEWAIPTLQALVDSDHEVCGVLTQPDRPAGRKKQMLASPVKQWAQEHGLPVFTPEKAGNNESFQLLKTLGADLYLVCAYGQILPQSLLELPDRGCFNLHFSKLPRWRGASPVQAAILAGDLTTGVSLQRMVLRLDAGPLVAESEDEAIRIDDSAESLGSRLSHKGAELTRKTLPILLEGNQKGVEQDDSRATYCRLIRKEQGRIDWMQEDAKAIDRKLRAFKPWPGIYCFGPDGKRLQLMELEVIDAELEPGLVGDGLLVGTLSGCLRILRIREEGKKEMDAASFLNGHPGFCGSMLQ